MTVVTVDTNKKELKRLAKQLSSMFSGCKVVMFSSPVEAASFIKDNPIDILFTEAMMRGITGFDLQEFAEELYPTVLTVIAADTDEYATKAMKMRTHGYIVKPVTEEEIRLSMSETRFGDTCGNDEHKYCV